MGCTNVSSLIQTVYLSWVRSYLCGELSEGYMDLSVLFLQLPTAL